MASLDRFDDEYSPTPGRTVTALQLDVRATDSVSICWRRAHIASGWQALYPHSLSKYRL